MQRVKSNLFFVLAAVVAVLLAIGVVSFAGPCIHEDGSHSTCYEASVYLMAVGACSAVLAIVGLVVGNDKGISVALGSAVAVLGAVAAAAPGNIWALCMMQSMRCWTVMQPFALACGVVLCVLGIAAAVKARPVSKSR